MRLRYAWRICPLSKRRSIRNASSASRIFRSSVRSRVRATSRTITQQLVRLVALTRDRTLERKIREALLALRIDRRFDKGQILQAYLNRIYLGDGHYGVEAAARGYFGKHASDLTAPEAAMLAGIIKCPSTCSPRVAPDVAKSQRDLVLKNMRAAGMLSAP